MKYGVVLPHYLEQATGQRIRQVAAAADELGFDSVWVSDHIVFPDTPELAWANTAFEALSVLSFVASITKRVALGTSVLVAPYRNPLVAAKTLATIDVLSEGRLLPAFGLGGLPGEFDALGIPFAERGARTDEYIKIIRGLWTSQPASFEGRFHRFSGLKFSPKPLQKPHPPIIIGGNSSQAIRRAAETGDGWHPAGKPPEVLGAEVAELRTLARKAGRPDPTIYLRAPLEIRTWPSHGRPRETLQGNVDEILLDLHKYQRAGVTHLVLDLLGDIPGMTGAMEQFMRDIRPRLVT